MIACLRHGFVLGAALGALLLTIEVTLGGAPLRGTAEAAGWMPAYVVAGAALGLLAALISLATTPRLARERAQGIQLFATVLALGVIGFGWLPYRLAGAESLLLRALLAFGLAVGLHLLGLAAAASPRAWMFAAFAAPFTATALLLFLCIAALFAREILPYGAETPRVEARSAPTAADEPPNLVIIVLEGVRADRLGCYGSFRATTPYLDSLAQEAVLFEQAFTSSSEHDAAFTGLLRGSRLVDSLSERGYRTWAGSGGGEVGSTSGPFALAGFDAQEDARKPRLAARLLLARLLAAARGEGLEPAPGGDSELVERALAWVRAGNGEHPFGMIVHFGETGPPYDPPRELRERFRPENLDAARFEELRLAQQTEWFRRAESGERDATAEEASSLSALQDAELLAADARIQHLVESLRAADLLERTLLVVTSDHGSRFGEEEGRLGSAGSAHDVVLHVPLIVRMPQRMPAATRARGLISFSDLTPGMLAALSGTSDNALARAAAGELPHEAVLATLRIGGVEHRVLRTAREKFLIGPDGELLSAGDLLVDPDETFLRRPLTGTDAEQKALKERLRVLLLDMARSARD